MKMKKIAIGLVILLCLSSVPLVAKAYDNKDANLLLETALREKTFYHYNIAYSEIMKVKNISTRDEMLGKLASISSNIWTPEIGKANEYLTDLVKTSSGRIYDNTESYLNNAKFLDLDRWYLLGELTSWGRKLVWTPDYKDAVEAIVKAWDVKTVESIQGAQKIVDKVQNPGNKAYLSEQLAEIVPISDDFEVIGID
ncbi:hypothetical protein [Clostridium algidicarnis]|uniref:hypothetical protein n=1 Tax=Clostridium algidicarnis TaxID=37659 RepID=UPI001C0B9DC9|nr:hypothetical protein [Clostridium algidicarnis]MBU3194459.1 hypothetical protein [Clostridium algidicarnis]MBU3205239.1 hypothetical protein [Clostridium algidicarnis]MBU3213392.1 hypothetical protein [Clostridium algidicarnis]MBU3223335.1 hypothetical protein [Clostridium algidicarnis]